MSARKLSADRLKRNARVIVSSASPRAADRSTRTPPGSRARISPSRRSPAAPVGHDQIDAREASGEAEHALRRGDVHHDQPVERRRLPRIVARSAEERGDAHRRAPPVDEEAEGVAGGHAERRRAARRDERRRGRGEEEAEIDAAARRAAGDIAEGAVGERVDAEHRHDASACERHAFDHRRRLADAVRAEPPVERVGDRSAAARERVRRPPGDGVGGAFEGARRARIGEVDGDHHRHPERDADDREHEQPRVPREVAQARAGEKRRDHPGWVRWWVCGMVGGGNLSGALT